MPKKIPIRVLGDEFEVVSEDSILRALQLYGYERGLPDYTELIASFAAGELPETEPAE